jgi:hypothetical protein
MRCKCKTRHLTTYQHTFGWALPSSTIEVECVRFDASGVQEASNEAVGQECRAWQSAAESGLVCKEEEALLGRDKAWGSAVRSSNSP